MMLRARRDVRSHWAVTGPVLQFMAAGLVAVAVVGLATGVASRRIGQREAISDARTTTLIKAQTIVEPVVTDGLLAREPASVQQVEGVVRERVLDASLVRVKIWTRDGLIVYSDEPRLEGTTHDLGDDEIAALDDGVIEAEVSDLSKPENRFERSRGKLLEVYMPIRSPGGERLLFEAYYLYDAVSASGNQIWRSFAPVSLGALIALELVQIPLAWSLARRLRQRQTEREQLLRQAVEASDAERRRIAGDLHDGVVQDLAGVAYALSSTARKERSPGAEVLDGAAVQVRDSIKSLRSLLVEIYPPRLAEAGLPAALTDLVAAASNRGLEVHLDLDRLIDPVPDHVAAVGFRAVQEGIRNVLAHAQANSVSVTAETQDGQLVIDVRDDGVGFTAEQATARAGEGHVGLRGLRDLITGAGGGLVVDSTPGGGTHMHVEVPLR